ncbi:MAG: RDD family protein [Puniceicoccales bacterium]|jgi:uncharacterized RDD family membrane protein YckC|nr:RDD family protein [Puniceicoccales bacterium]
MSDTPQKEPPPLPSNISLPDSLKHLIDPALAPSPAPAPFLLRVFAYLLDWLLAMLVFLLLLKFIVQTYRGEEWEILKTWLITLRNDYLNLFGNPAIVTSEMSASFLQKVKNIPQPASDLIQFIAFVQTFFFWSYFFVTEYFSQGSSIGKRVFNLRVANIYDLGPPRFFDTLVRSGWKSLFFCSSRLLFLLIGVIDAHVPLFTRTRRSWHDIFSHTIVLDSIADHDNSEPETPEPPE